MTDHSNALLARHLRGELTPPEQRQLAQEALDDPELFELLTAAAVVNEALVAGGSESGGPAVANQPAAEPAQPVVAGPRLATPLRRKSHFVVAAAGLAAAAVIALLFVFRSSPPYTPAPAVTSPEPGAATASRPDAADSGAAATAPILLTAYLDSSRLGSSPQFRGTAADSRPPRADGIVVSSDHGEVAIDLGSLDGVEQGITVPVLRGTDPVVRVGTITIVRVFRERAVGMAAAGDSPQSGDHVALSAAIQVNALAERLTAVVASGDLAGARSLAERAVALAQAPGVGADQRRRALVQLGALERRDAASAAAERHLRAAVAELDGLPAAARNERADTLNELGAVLIDRGNHADAETVLRRAEPYASGAARVHVTNNLAAVSALRGDRAMAETMYRAALVLAGAAPSLAIERDAIQKNLDALGLGR